MTNTVEEMIKKMAVEGFEIEEEDEEILAEGDVEYALQDDGTIAIFSRDDIRFDLEAYKVGWQKYANLESLDLQYKNKVDKFLRGRLGLVARPDADFLLFTFYSLMDSIATQDKCIPIELQRFVDFLAKNYRNCAADDTMGRELKRIGEYLVGVVDMTGRNAEHEHSSEGYLVAHAEDLAYVLIQMGYKRHLNTEGRNYMFVACPNVI